MTRLVSWSGQAITRLEKRWKPVALWTALWVGIAAVGLSPLWRPLEQAEFDWLTILTAPGAPNTPILVVEIDEPSFAELGLHWPWPRGLHGRLIEALAAAGAAVIAFDVLFAEPSEPLEDQRFAAAIRGAGKVVLAATEIRLETAQTVQTMRIDPLETFLNAGATAGLVGLSLDGDAIPRRFPTHPESFWRKVVEQFGGPAAATEWAPGALIRYAGGRGSFPHVSYYQTLDPETFLPPGLIAGRIVLVGFAASSSPAPEQQADLLATPFVRTSGELTPGVEIQAHIVDTTLRNRVLREAPLGGRLALLGVAAALAWVALSRWRPLPGALRAAGLSGAFLGLAVAAFTVAHCWLPVAAPIAGIWLTYLAQGGRAFLQERAQRVFVRRVFGLYVADEIIDHMLAHPGRLALGGERREVSFIFTDIADFTALTEAIPPAALVALLEDYFAGMSEIALAYQGTIERCIGDSLVAFFNAPVEQPDHPARAVACALELDAFAQAFAARQKAQGIALGATRIGVNTGAVAVGNFGGTRRFHYTAMGDPVNTAARLESANKYFGTRLCVSGATAGRCPGMVFRPIGEILLKGKTQPVEVFEPVAQERLAQLDITAYRRAYALLQKGDRAALEAFAQLVAHTPADSLSAYHLARLRAGETGVRIVLAGK